MAAAVRQHPEARTKEDRSLIKVTIPDRHLDDEAKRTILRETLTRYRNELMDDEERQLLLDRIKRLQRQLRLA